MTRLSSKGRKGIALEKSENGDRPRGEKESGVGRKMLCLCTIQYLAFFCSFLLPEDCSVLPNM